MNKRNPRHQALIQKAEEAVAQGELPQGPVPVPGTSPIDVMDLAEELFDPERDLAEVCGPQAIKVKLSRKWLWIHGLSPEEALWVNSRASADLSAAQLTSAADQTLYYRFRAQCWQVIASCRRGPSAESKPVFTPEHIEVLFRNKNPGEGAISAISKLSDTITNNVDERLPPVVLDFFGAGGDLLRICASGLSTQNCMKWQPVLAALADCVLRIRLQKTLSLGDLEGFPRPPAE